MKLLKHISLTLLAVIYLSTACAYTVRVIASDIPASGANAVLALFGQAKQAEIKTGEQYRHMPLSNQIQVPPTHIGETEFPILTDFRGILLDAEPLQEITSYYYSFSSGRAPPVA
jgi:hypothetical protein